MNTEIIELKDIATEINTAKQKQQAIQRINAWAISVLNDVQGKEEN